jgi:5-methylcytosine-specific restriction endonuclease McrA
MKGQAHATPEVAIKLALGDEKVVNIPARAKRRNQRRAKIRLWNKGIRRCHWCEGKFKSMEEATVDHRIPLGKGGLNNDNNKVLACEKCNHTKDNQMPSYETINDLLKAKGLVD